MNTTLRVYGKYLRDAFIWKGQGGAPHIQVRLGANKKNENHDEEQTYTLHKLRSNKSRVRKRYRESTAPNTRKQYLHQTQINLYIQLSPHRHNYVFLFSEVFLFSSIVIFFCVQRAPRSIPARNDEGVKSR